MTSFTYLIFLIAHILAQVRCVRKQKTDDELYYQCFNKKCGGLEDDIERLEAGEWKCYHFANVKHHRKYASECKAKCREPYAKYSLEEDPDQNACACRECKTYPHHFCTGPCEGQLTSLEECDNTACIGKKVKYRWHKCEPGQCSSQKPSPRIDSPGKEDSKNDSSRKIDDRIDGSGNADPSKKGVEAVVETTTPNLTVVEATTYHSETPPLHSKALDITTQGSVPNDFTSNGLYNIETSTRNSEHIATRADTDNSEPVETGTDTRNSVLVETTTDTHNSEPVDTTTHDSEPGENTTHGPHPVDTTTHGSMPANITPYGSAPIETTTSVSKTDVGTTRRFVRVETTTHSSVPKRTTTTTPRSRPANTSTHPSKSNKTSKHRSKTTETAANSSVPAQTTTSKPFKINLSL